MQRFLVPTLATIVIVGGVWLAPQQAAAQSTGQTRSYNQNGPTASGDPWMNENDLDYNRRHWLPSDNNGRNQSSNQNFDRNQRGYDQSNRYNEQGYNQGQSGNQAYPQYQRNYNPNQGNYGQNGRNGQGYDNRYGSTYPNSNGYPGNNTYAYPNNNYQRNYNGQPGYGRSAPSYGGSGYNGNE